MNRFNKFLKKLDDSVPDPWIVDGSVQGRPTFQLGIIVGMFIGIIIYFIFFN